MIDFEDYPIEFKYLPIQCIIFFSDLKTLDNGSKTGKTVMEFCNYYKEKYKTTDIPQPQFVAKICDKLCDNNHLSVFNRGGLFNMDNSYACILQDKSFINQKVIYEYLNEKFSCLVYGFKYIYNYYQEYVLPILNIDAKGDSSIGSSFLYQGGILTAKHCIEGANKIAIKGINSENLKSAKFFIHENNGMDLIFIKFSKEILNSINFDSDASVLDEVIALGFPQIPGYQNFLTAERATVSSRFYATKGQVTSIAEDIWMKENLILITAKIRGGNSGGPIINEKGMVIGVASNIPTGKGNYDDLGYGTVIPIKFAKDIISNCSSELDVSNIEFIDFKE